MSPGLRLYEWASEHNLNRQQYALLVTMVIAMRSGAGAVIKKVELVGNPAGFGWAYQAQQLITELLNGVANTAEGKGHTNGK